MPNETYFTSTDVFSHKLANSFIYDILVAKKAKDAYLIISAPLLDVFIYLVSFLTKGK